MSEPKKVLPGNVSNITDNLRGKERPQGNVSKTMFVWTLLSFSAMNTFRLFASSFGLLGLPIAIAAIAMYDGGYLFWQNQVIKHAQNDKQKRVAEIGRAVSLIGCGVMIVLDMALHSGQSYIPLDWEFLVFGWSAMLKDVFGGTAMFMLVGMFIFHGILIERFEHHDVKLQQDIAERQARSDAENRRLQMLKAQNAMQSELTAVSVEALYEIIEDEKAETAKTMGKMLRANVVGEWAQQLTGGEIIDAEARDVRQPAPAPATQKAAEADVNFTPPVKGRAQTK
jgi:hypothetical protein